MLVFRRVHLPAQGVGFFSMTNLTYTYDENTPAKQGDIFEDAAAFGFISTGYMEGIFVALTPVQNKNLAVSVTYTQFGKIITKTPAYTFDGAKNIATDKISISGITEIDSAAFQFKCKN